MLTGQRTLLIDHVGTMNYHKRVCIWWSKGQTGRTDEPDMIEYSRVGSLTICIGRGRSVQRGRNCRHKEQAKKSTFISSTRTE